jgi:adenylate cyclase
VTNTTVQKINGLLNSAALIAKMTKGVVSKNETLSDELVPYFLSGLKENPDLYSINTALKNGKYLALINLTSAYISSYYTKNEALPVGSKYAIRRIDPNAAPAIETWEYLDKEGKSLAKESLTPPSVVLKETSWFQSQVKHPSIDWRNSEYPWGYLKEGPKKEKGISVSVPVLSEDGNLEAIIGANLTLKSLSNFVTHQTLGVSGRIFILNEKGEILVPTPDQFDDISTRAATLIPSAMLNYKDNHESDFIMGRGKKKDLVAITTLPLSYETKWILFLTVPFEDFFGQITLDQKHTLAISFLALALCTLLIYFSAKHISQPIVLLADEVDKIRGFHFNDEFSSVRSHIDEIIHLSESILTMRTAIESFSRYVPKEIVKALVQLGQPISLGGERKELVILFSDITNFTTISEKLPTEELTPLLSRYFDVLSKEILALEGTIDKYIGDSIMAFWGAPKSVEEMYYKACMAVLRCHKKCNLNAQENNLPLWETRFGMHVGDVIVGNVGTLERMNYTILGDAVNVASRFCAINKQYRTSKVIGEKLYKKIASRLIARPLDCVAVKGKVEKLTIYELVGTTEGEFASSSEEQELCRLFAAAYQAFQEGSKKEAQEQFLAISKKFPSDGPTQIYLERLKD